jgi:hypothetical protein
MDRRTAIAKATTDTTVAAAGLLSPSQSRSFTALIREEAALGDVIRTVSKGTVEGEINKIGTGTRLLRRKIENHDDGYRAAPTFPTVPYLAKGVRLPVEITEDVFHQNIEGEGAEATILREMASQIAADLEDLNVNGDESYTGADEDFLNIDDGLLKKLEDSTEAERVDAGTIEAGALSKAHFFAAKAALPNKYKRQRPNGSGALVWLMSPTTASNYQEYLTERGTAAGDAALTGARGTAATAPLGYDIVEVPTMEDGRIVLTPKGNLVRVVTWNMRRRKVTGETDWELATRDKRGYIWFLEQDFIIETEEAIVDMYGVLAPDFA